MMEMKFPAAPAVRLKEKFATFAVHASASECHIFFPR